jgi:hypothetical protein
MKDIVSEYDTVQKLIANNSRLNLNNFAIDLLNSALTSVPQKDDEECHLEYHIGSMEHRMWSLGLLSMSWILANLKRKVTNGHCNNINHNHGELEPRQCHRGSSFHDEMYKECLNSFKNRLQIAEENPPRLVPE